MHSEAKATVLTMEDDDVIRQTMAIYLDDSGYKVIEAASGESGMKAFAENTIDIVLLDWRLPGMPGNEVLSALAEKSPTTPVIVVSGTDQVKEVVDALQRGAWDFLMKPLSSLVVLENSIDRCLERARLLREEGLRREFLEEQVTLRTEELEKANALLRKQMTERMEFERALAESEERFRQLVENVREVFFVRDMQTRSFLYVSPAYAEVWGISCAALHTAPDTFLTTINSEDRPKVEEEYELLMTAGKPFDQEFRITRPDGAERWVHCRAFPVEDIFGQPYRVVGVTEDITQRKQAENRLRDSLHEKDILLKEVHHRVKNNLQLVSSLLNLQAGYIRSPEDRELFLESQGRIQSMTLVHEELYRSDDLARINFKDYLPKLTHKLIAAFAVGKEIRLATDIENIFLPVDVAIPCGLIINELFSNALKHAFPGREAGEVTLSTQYEKNRVHITVSDDGIGFPLDYDPATARSLGMQLVHSLVDQLGAFLDITVNKGTTFAISFALPEKSVIK